MKACLIPGWLQEWEKENTMKCEKCQDRGFIEENHGLLIIACDCEAGEDYRTQMRELPGIPKEDNWEVEFEDVDDSNSRIEPDNSDAGGDNPSEPRKPRKRKTGRKAAKKSG